jgi:hypothetical protein
MSLDDLAKLIFRSDLEYVALTEVGGAELGCTPPEFLYMWYLMFCIR